MFSLTHISDKKRRKPTFNEDFGLIIMNQNISSRTFKFGFHENRSELLPSDQKKQRISCFNNYVMGARDSNMLIPNRT